MKVFKYLYVFSLFVNVLFANAKIDLGVDVFFKEKKYLDLKNSSIALVINQTSVDKNLQPTFTLFLENAKDYKIKALFTLEHGLNGNSYAGEKIENSELKKISVFSLHGSTKRPTKEMLEGIDTLIYDIQEIGSRSYTYATSLYYLMEEAARQNIKIIILDRPNPINGIIVDGPMLNDEYRSFLGYINVPYCHGMTLGELALFFNSEYGVNCKLEVIPMQNWKREMSFDDTKLHWIPTSPNIPESTTAFFYPTTGILGELEIVNIGVGYTLPFKIIGAPWIDAEKFSKKLNEQKLLGVKFFPFYFKPFYGPYKGKNCQGVRIVITDTLKYRPLATQYLLIGILKSLYPEKLEEKFKSLSSSKVRTFCLVNGNCEIYDILTKEKYPAWKMIQFQEDKVKAFKEKRKKYLLY